MQLVPMLDSSTDENTVSADTTAVIKAEQSEQDLEVTGMELNLGEPVIVKSDNTLQSKFIQPSSGSLTNFDVLTPIWEILGTELASFLDKKSRVTFSVLMTSYLTDG